jgi:phosphoglycerol transferase MdoB-like AlkP superfamily enzyme
LEQQPMTVADLLATHALPVAVFPSNERHLPALVFGKQRLVIALAAATSRSSAVIRKAGLGLWTGLDLAFMATT